MIPNDTQDLSADRSTHAVDIVAFVEANELAPHHVETPYRLVPAPGGEYLYSLLRDTLEQTGRIAIAYVVIQAHHHLAAVVPHGPLLMLNTLRWTRENMPQPERSRLIGDVLLEEQGDSEDIELALMAQSTPGTLRLMQEEEAHDDGSCFRADILTPDDLTEDDDEIDRELARVLRRRSTMHGCQPYRPQRPQPRFGRQRTRLTS